MSRVARSIFVQAALQASLSAAIAGSQDSVIVAVGADVETLNEYVASSTLAIDLADQLFLGLMEETPADADGLPGLAPRLARAWKFSPDGLSVTFQLREDVVWSDGRPTTSEDVRFTWRAQVDPDLGWPDADLKDDIADVKVVDAHRVTFILNRRTPFTLLDINEGRILPAHALTGLPPSRWRQTDLTPRLVTNGPFRIGKRVPGQSIELVRNPSYYEPGLPRLARIVFRIVSDPAIRLQQTLAGENDVLETVAPDSAARIVADPEMTLIRLDQRMYTYIAWNIKRPIFFDPRVRRALTMALDRQEMLEVLAGGMGRPAIGPIVSSQWAADPALRPLPFDPGTARRLLEEAGWRDADGDGTLEREGVPLRFDLEFNRGNILRENLALRASAQLAEIGVRASPRALEWAAFQSRHRQGDFDAFVASRIAPTRVSLDSFTTGAPLNYGGYSNPELDELARRAAAAATLEEARPLWSQAQAIVAQDQPMSFLFEQDRLYAVRRRLRGVSAGSLGIFSTLRSWSVERAADAQPDRR